MAYVLCLKEMHVISVTGHSLLLESKLAPQQVPDEVLPELQARGCVPCDEQGNVLVNGQPIAVRRLQYDPDLPVPPKVAERKYEPMPPSVTEEMAIDAATKAVLDAKDQTLLDRVHGFPKVHSVSERAGFRVTRLQIIAACKRLGYC